MVKNKESRLRIDTTSSSSSEFKLLLCLAEDLANQQPELFQAISPCSFETEPGELRLIFNKEHPRCPSSMCIENCFGISINIGTFRYASNT